MALTKQPFCARHCCPCLTCAPRNGVRFYYHPHLGQGRGRDEERGGERGRAAQRLAKIHIYTRKQGWTQ